MLCLASDKRLIYKSRNKWNKTQRHRHSSASAVVSTLRRNDYWQTQTMSTMRFKNCFRVWQNKGIADTEGQRQAFMHITLRNICVDMLRRRRHFEDIDTSAEAQAETSNAASRIDAADSVADLRIRIRQCMSGKILRVFEMYAFNEMDYTEISSELGISIDVARSYMCRARKIVRTQCREALKKL